ncbi:putative aliphatic sulfonates transport permease protein SsuC [Paenibacillus sp. CCS19]|uniref:ABC transporter permease n=1 Tax=Paenibacillus sp. CCS19 TaxID=3158387 RepID=UPI00256D3F77|nr:ABC transporter permease [Paenibacillus cellulosilyticus]GMK40968.1 putative aliphatic sulfonates transport permease protein SsuC [Paenibacillus cellulosilyticus]
MTSTIAVRSEQAAPPNIERRKRAFPWKSAVRGAIIPAVVIALWQILSSNGSISETMYSSPWNILQQYYELTKTGELPHHLRISLVRASLGFLFGGGAGLLIGLLVGMSRQVEEVMNPTVQMLRTIPLLAITPLFIMWFGFGELSKVLLISLGAFFPMYVNTFLGVRNVDAKLFDVGRVLEFNWWKRTSRLVLPAALPNILLGTRLSLSIAWLCLVVAELLGAESGVGYMIQDARSFVQTDVVFVGITIFAIVGKLSDSIVRVLEQRLLRWQDSFKG